MGVCFSNVDTDEKSTNTPRLPNKVEKSTNTDYMNERCPKNTFFPSSNSSRSLKVFINSPECNHDNYSPVYTPIDATTYSYESFLASGTGGTKPASSTGSCVSRNTSYFNSWDGHD